MANPVHFGSAAILALVSAGLMLSPPADAHHSFALFDSSKSVRLEGKVKAFEWTNPHSWIRLVVIGENNQPEEWLIELPAAASLARDGWGKTYLKPGERLVVQVNPLKNGMKVGSLQSFRSEAE
jgi:hypothetical protein